MSTEVFEVYGRRDDSNPREVFDLAKTQWPDLRFKDIQKSRWGHYATFTKEDSPDVYCASRSTMIVMLEFSERDGQSLPHVQLAQHALNRADNWQVIKNIPAKIATSARLVAVAAVCGAAVFFTAGFGMQRLLSAVYDPRDDRELAAAKPLVGQPDVSYNAETRAAYKKDSQKLLLKWTFNEEGQLDKACTVQVRQPNDPLGAWAHRKYTETCFTGDAIPSLLKPTFKLP